MNSARCPFAVCSTTHGAILAESFWLGEPACSVASEELIAASPAKPAAVNRNEKKVRRQRGVMTTRFSFLIIGIGITPPIEMLRSSSRCVELFRALQQDLPCLHQRFHALRETNIARCDYLSVRISLSRPKEPTDAIDLFSEGRSAASPQVPDVRVERKH